MSAELKSAFAAYMGGFFASIVPNTPALREFVARPLAKAVVLAPGRMVDAADEMLASWRRNDNDGAPASSALMPVILIALAKDVTPSAPEFSPQVATEVDVMIPGDVQERAFKMRKAQVDVRAQVVFAAADEPTATSMARQFLLWCSAIPNRRFYAYYDMAGMKKPWPCVLEMPDIIAVPVGQGEKNMTVLAADLTIRASIPYLRTPLSVAGLAAAGEVSDGNGAPPDVNGLFDPADPPGYQVVREVVSQNEVEIVHSHGYIDGGGEAQTVFHPGKTDDNDNLAGT